MGRQLVGRCVYCESVEELTDEHIVPRSLLARGVEEWILEKASCRRCAQRTSRFEGVVAGRVARGFRETFGTKSRRKAKLEPHRMEMSRNGVATEVTVDSEDAIASFPFPLLHPPGLFLERPQRDRISIDGVGFLNTREGPAELARRLGVDAVGIPGQYRVGAGENEIEAEPGFGLYVASFAQMLGKIGHCFALSKVDRSQFDELYLPRFLIGSPVGIDWWVGISLRETRAIKNQNYQVDGGLFEGEYIARVRLYGLNRDVPEYTVVVGRMTTHYREVHRITGYPTP